MSRIRAGYRMRMVRTGERFGPLLITALLASCSGADSAPTSTSGPDKPATTGGGASSAPVRAGAASVTGRDLYAWPFSWDSIWNLPLSRSARYHPVDLAVDAAANEGRGISVDPEDISLDPSLPVRTVLAQGISIQVHLDTSLAGNADIKGNWNNCATFLTPDGAGIHQGQPLNYPATGTPSFANGWPLVSLKGTGIPGCHGGSGLSGLGGSIRRGEMSSSGPLRHALKIELDCILYCSRRGPGGRAFTWPATNEDGGYTDPQQGNYYDRFGTADPLVLQGTLLALPPAFEVAALTSPNARKIAQALMDYGGYVVDNTAWSFHNPTVRRGVNALAVQRGVENELAGAGCPAANTDDADTGCAFYSDLRRVFAGLAVVVDNSAATPGGGAIGTARRAGYAPAFSDGSGAPPPTP